MVSTVDVAVEAEIGATGKGARLLSDMLRWKIDDVGALKATWTTSVTGDVHTGKGLTTTAEFTTPATGLPASNGAFGSKTLRLSVEGGNVIDTTDVEIFYPRDPKNHAGGQVGSPNWYHYWSETSANHGTHTWEAGGGSGQTRFENGQWRAYIRQAQGHTAGGTWNNAEGIDLFANLARHEERHRLDMIALWGANTNRIASQDIDGDFLPDAQEANLVAGRAYDPTDDDTYMDTFNYLAQP